MDPMALGGMLFTLILVAMIGGFILLLPITRRLGAILEQRLSADAAAGLPAERVRRLESAVQALTDELERLAERQEFTEALLSERRPLTLPKDGPSG
jgi:hypothetical protein